MLALGLKEGKRVELTVVGVSDALTNVVGLEGTIDGVALELGWVDNFGLALIDGDTDCVGDLDADPDGTNVEFD